MPSCGSQIILCDVPIRYDTYKGCSHGCKYCFVTRKYDIADIKFGEGVEALQNFISGKRSKETKWCDWNIPLHWGGVSDPFQPCEKKYKRSLNALKVFAESKYPFVVSTKNKMIADSEYLELIKQCNCVVQFSAICSKFDKLEPGASTFNQRIVAASKISKHKRVIIRVQPYITNVFEDVMKNIEKFSEVGIYGIVIEGIKYFHKREGLVKVGADYCYPKKILKQHFTQIKAKCHKYGLKFYCGENRLRNMGDDLCCCGVDGMGWRVNKSNFNHFLHDRQNFVYTQIMKSKGTATAFQSGYAQDSVASRNIKNKSYKECMQACLKDKNYLNIYLSN